MATSLLLLPQARTPALTAKCNDIYGALALDDPTEGDDSVALGALHFAALYERTEFMRVVFKDVRYTFNLPHLIAQFLVNPDC
jgi:hypothetical protein